MSLDAVFFSQLEQLPQRPFSWVRPTRAGSKPPILGQGEHQYEAIHDWGELPRTIRFGNTHGVCEDSQGNIYVHHTVHATSENPDTMVVFDHKGKFVRSWGRQFKGGAHGLTIRKEGSDEFLFLCDYQHGIVTKRTLKGEEVFTLVIQQNRRPTSPRIKLRRWSIGQLTWPLLPTATFTWATDMAPASSIQPESRVRPNLWRTREGRRPDRLSPWLVGRYPRRDTASGGDRPRQWPLAAIYARWQARRFHPGNVEDALLSARAERRRGDRGPVEQGDDPRSKEPGGRKPGRERIFEPRLEHGAKSGPGDVRARPVRLSSRRLL